MKIIKVKSCEECPYFAEGVAYYAEASCSHDKSDIFNEIKKPSKIPEWCPLEDK